MSKVAELRSACATTALALVDGQPPKRIQLLAIGENAKRDGGKPFVVRDRAHAQDIISRTEAYYKSTEPMVDYDHQSVFGAKDGVGGRAPAAGWMPKLMLTDAGIEADVEWTAAASAAISAKEYRYISPYFGHTPEGVVTRIFNAALTNRPELELRAVASVTDTTSEDEPLDKDLLIALGLAEGATPADAIAAAKALKTELGAVCSALGLTATAKAADIAVKLGELKTAASQGGAPDPASFVPRAEFDRVAAQVSSITEDRTTASVDGAIKVGKISPASRDWALGYAKRDPEGFASFLSTAVVIVEPGAEERRAAAVKEDKLTDEERAVCSAMGISEADFLASRKEAGK